MSHTSTVTETYSVLDIEAVHCCVTADLIMIATSSGAISETKAREYGHDIEVLAKNNYLKKVDVTLLSNGAEMRAIQYETNIASGSIKMSRPGGVLWPKVNNPHLRIVLSYYNSYTNEAREKMSSKLKIAWVSTNIDTSHVGLKAMGGRDYASNAYGMQRKDFGA